MSGHNGRRRNRLRRFGSFFSASRYRWRSEYVYGKQYARYTVSLSWGTFHSECCRVIVPAPPLDVVLVIAHVFPTPYPAHVLLLRVQHAVYQWLHAAVVKTVSFVQIDHVKLVLCLFASVFHTKVEIHCVCPRVLMSGFMTRSYSLS